MSTPSTTSRIAGYPPPVAQRPSRPGSVPPPSGAWQGVSWFAFALGSITFFYATWYAPSITVSDRYFLYCAVLFSFFGSLSVSKAVRDREENIPITSMYYGLSFVAAIAPFVLVAFNLVFDSGMPEVNRALLGMSYALATFAVLAIAKNERDKQAARKTAN